MSMLRRQRLDMLTALNLADSQRAMADRQGARDADVASKWAGALSTLAATGANAAGKVYDVAEDAAIDDATAFANQHADVVDAQEAASIIDANPDLQPMQAQGPLEAIAAGVMNPLRAKKRATASTLLTEQAQANTKQRMVADIAAEKAALEQRKIDEAAAARAAELARRQAADAAAAADRAKGLDLKEREVKVKERPKPGPSPEAAARRAKQDEKLDLEIAALKQRGVDPTDLRGEFNKLPEVKAFTDVSVAYDKMKAAASKPSAAGDLSLIFAFMKMLDPGSTVREGEFANAQNAGGVGDVVVNAYNRVLSGERLNDDQRKDFLGQAASAYAAQKRVRDAAVSRYGALATKRGADPVDVTGVDGDDGFDDVWSDQ